MTLIFFGYILSTNSFFAFDSLQHHTHIHHRKKYDQKKAVIVV